MTMNPKLLHWLSGVFVVFTLAAAIWTNNASVVTHNDGPIIVDHPPGSGQMRQPDGFSHGLMRRAQLGLPQRINFVVVAVELASSPEAYRETFDDLTAPPAVASPLDRAQFAVGLFRDYFLIFGYTGLMVLLGLRTWLPGFPCPRWVQILLVVCPMLVGVLDVAENIGAQAALNQYTHLPAQTTYWTAAASWLKWALAFVGMGLLGWSFLGLERQSGIGAFLRELAGIILLSVGCVGVVAVWFPSMIPMTFTFGLVAILPVGLMLVFPDAWWGKVVTPCEDK